MLIEIKGAGKWLDVIKQHYDIKDTILRDQEEAFTILVSPSPNRTMIIARYDRTRKFGVVFTTE